MSGKQLAAYAGCLTVFVACAAVAYDTLFPSPSAEPERASATLPTEATAGLANTNAEWPPDPSTAAVPFYDDTIRLALAPPTGDSDRQDPTPAPLGATPETPPDAPLKTGVTKQLEQPVESSRTSESELQTSRRAAQLNRAQSRRKNPNSPRRDDDSSARQESRHEAGSNQSADDRSSWRRNRGIEGITLRGHDEGSFIGRARTRNVFWPRNYNDENFAHRRRDDQNFKRQDRDEDGFAWRNSDIKPVGRRDRDDENFGRRDRHTDKRSRSNANPFARETRDRDYPFRSERGAREANDGWRQQRGASWGTFFWR